MVDLGHDEGGQHCEQVAGDIAGQVLYHFWPSHSEVRLLLEEHLQGSGEGIPRKLLHHTLHGHDGLAPLHNAYIEQLKFLRVVRAGSRV